MRRVGATARQSLRRRKGGVLRPAGGARMYRIKIGEDDMASIQNRRMFVASLGLFAVCNVAGAIGEAWAQGGGTGPLAQTIQDVEKRLKARLGVFILDTETGQSWRHRADERFPMCSTFKAVAGGAILALVDQGKEELNRRIVLQQSDLVTYSPITKERLGGQGMTIGELCEAAITVSDNTAGNMMLKVIGGPEGFTAFVRSIGDSVTRLDRWETDLNEATPGDLRDTTTPAAMSATMQTLVLGNALSSKSREQLVAWLVGNKVGDTKIRAGLPNDWRVGDKTGAGLRGTNNDTGIIWPPNRRPVVISLFTTETEASVGEKNAGMADIARQLQTTISG
jgi:beta-lactamase class A